MHPRAVDLIARLRLVPHPEGGYYRQTFRSTSRVQPSDARPPRAALTTIYFLLPEGDVSRWHRVSSDESWHYHEGAPLDLHVADAQFAGVARYRIGPIADGVEATLVVPAGHWQAARSTGAYTLVACSVGPGFEFDDFALLRDRPDEAERVRRTNPEAAAFI